MEDNGRQYSFNGTGWQMEDAGGSDAVNSSSLAEKTRPSHSGRKARRIFITALFFSPLSKHFVRMGHFSARFILI